MRSGIVMAVALGLMGCASGGVFGGREPDVVVVGDDGRRYPDGDRRYPDDRDYPDRRGRGGDGEYGRGYRTLRVPRGQYPPRGACRVWYEGRPHGRQPRAVSCDRLYGRVPYGAFVLYNGNAWDMRYDWYRNERRYRGGVPRVIAELSQSMRRRY